STSPSTCGNPWAAAPPSNASPAPCPADREARIAELTDTDGRHVLIATDCLSEGVNLQQHFQAVVHYDLAWNPTRHEQREGRVDRFGQPRDIVRAVTIIGADNQIDEIVMRVLLRKHEAIRKQLGISVPVPDSANHVVEVVMEELLAQRRPEQPDQPAIEGMDELIRTRRADLHREWDSFAEREDAALTKYAQTGIKPDEVARELAEIRASLGTGPQIEEFTREALDALGASLTGNGDGFTAVTVTLPPALRGALPPGHAQPLPFHRELPVPRRHAHLDCTDPSVRAVARYVLESALDDKTPGPRPARRCGVLHTGAVTRRTTVLLVRFRLHLTVPARTGPRPMVAEEARVLAYRGRPTDPDWLAPDEVEALLAAEPTGNVAPELARDDLERIIDRLGELQPHRRRGRRDGAAALGIPCAGPRGHPAERRQQDHRGGAPSLRRARRLPVPACGHRRFQRCERAVSRSPFPALRIAGGLLPADLFGRVLEGKDLPGWEPEAYGLAPHESVRQAATRAFDYLSGAWEAFTRERDKAINEGRPLTRLTRERWLLTVFRALDYGILSTTPSGGLVAEDKSFQVSHVWEHVPIHLLGWGVDLDRRTKGMIGAADAAPQSMVQELLNRTDEHLWAIVSNGRKLRLLRDSRALAGSAYVEFDLELIFDEQLFPTSCCCSGWCTPPGWPCRRASPRPDAGWSSGERAPSSRANAPWHGYAAASRRPSPP
ncbi:MAG TPA: helicase-related protein, partial [Pseudonocardiaceae bacterium]|nr:helicase-related protein [Pseudonocardiaceae bacterium]